jgi:hypothetical protein
MGLATLSPEFYRHAFIGVPTDHGAMIRYAWVGGSIWGAEFGGFVSLVVGLVVLRANWRHQNQPLPVAEPAGSHDAGSSEFTASQRGDHY